MHLTLVATLPRGAHGPVHARPTVIELAEAPEPPRAPEPTPEAPERAPSELRQAARPRPAGAPRPASRASTPSEAPPSEAPIDFTNTTFSSEGPGLAIGGGGSGGPAVRTAAPAIASAVIPAGPRFVPASSLSRGPRAPGLDAALERNYPPDARRNGVAGKAMLRVAILSDGRVGPVKQLSESSAGFGEACAKTVRAARWEPPLDREGRPVATEITYACKFEVRS